MPSALRYGTILGRLHRTRSPPSVASDRWRAESQAPSRAPRVQYTARGRAAAGLPVPKRRGRHPFGRSTGPPEIGDQPRVAAVAKSPVSDQHQPSRRAPPKHASASRGTISRLRMASRSRTSASRARAQVHRGPSNPTPRSGKWTPPADREADPARHCAWACANSRAAPLADGFGEIAVKIAEERKRLASHPIPRP